MFLVGKGVKSLGKGNAKFVKVQTEEGVITFALDADAYDSIGGPLETEFVMDVEKFAELVKNLGPETFMYVSHGNNFTIGNEDQVGLLVRKFDDMMGPKVKTLRLYVCHAGKGENSIAEQLQRGLADIRPGFRVEASEYYIVPEIHYKDILGPRIANIEPRVIDTKYWLEGKGWRFSSDGIDTIDAKWRVFD